MKKGRSLICQKLNDIKVDHKLTNARWAELSGVPVGTINRYLSYNVGVPNFPYICAMLTAVGVTPNEFYAGITDGGTTPGETMVESPAIAMEASLDPQEDAILLESMRERIAQQSDRIQALEDASYEKDERIHELDAQLRELHAEKRAVDNLIEERDRSIARRDGMIASKNKIIFILGALLGTFMLIDLLFANFGWFRFGPIG